MKNVYDIRYENNLIYVLSSAPEALWQEIYSDTLIIVYLYYLDTLSVYLHYLDGIPEAIHVCLVSSRKEVLREARRHMEASGRKNIRYILKENRGRDVSALLVTCADLIKDYEYVCFLHDKKERSAEVKRDTELWIKNLWGNTVGSAGYIGRVLQLFLENPSLGVLAPPEPVGDHFCTWYGYGWHDSFGITEELVEKLCLDTDIRQDKPPVTIGTALWFRRDALQKLFDHGWEYSDFDDEGLRRQDYLSYGIERIFPYVAQDAGYDTGTVMTEAYAAIQTNYLQHAANLIFKEAEPFFPVNNLADLERYRSNKSSVIEFAKRNQEVYLYGAGTMGQFCLSLLRKENIQPEGFVVSKGGGVSMVDCIPVIELERLEHLPGRAVVITVYALEVQDEIAKLLEERGCQNYIRMWEKGI
ncbi:rhamnan synthesis F family protein [Sporofaciens sp. JLR.KK001]|uniref:rhamnan synthesis F family protein n=1 Tax=Sporofaciens sp. JLR.KK001 TaxID=3112621 RepID=UPI002FF1071B